MQILRHRALDFDDVVIIPQNSTMSSRKDVMLMRTFVCPHSNNSITGSPIIAANMSTVGTVNLAEELADNAAFTCLHKYIDKPVTLSQRTKKFAFLTYGMHEDFGMIEDDVAAVNAPFPLLCFDVAHGHIQKFVDRIKLARTIFPNAIIIAGNVVTEDGTFDLIKAGATFVKAGIANGKACRTKNKTGVGLPQLTTVIECARVAHENNAFLISDGGHREPADICKAIGAGADMVMLGSMLAGHKETLSGLEMENLIGINSCWVTTDDHPRDRVSYQQLNSSFNIDHPSDFPVSVYGMSSEEAMNKFHGGMAKYRASEGASFKVPYRGTVKTTLNDIYGSLRSVCTYSNTSHIFDLHRNIIFRAVNG